MKVSFMTITDNTGSTRIGHESVIQTGIFLFYFCLLPFAHLPARRETGISDDGSLLYVSTWDRLSDTLNAGRWVLTATGGFSKTSITVHMLGIPNQVTYLFGLGG